MIQFMWNHFWNIDFNGFSLTVVGDFDTPPNPRWEYRREYMDGWAF